MQLARVTSLFLAVSGFRAFGELCDMNPKLESLASLHQVICLEDLCFGQWVTGLLVRAAG